MASGIWVRRLVNRMRRSIDSVGRITCLTITRRMVGKRVSEVMSDSFVLDCVATLEGSVRPVASSTLSAQDPINGRVLLRVLLHATSKPQEMDAQAGKEWSAGIVMRSVKVHEYSQVRRSSC